MSENTDAEERSIDLDDTLAFYTTRVPMSASDVSFRATAYPEAGHAKVLLRGRNRMDMTLVLTPKDLRTVAARFQQVADEIEEVSGEGT